MNLFGSIARLVNVIWAKDGQPITLRPSQSVTYAATTDVQLPPSAAVAQVLVSEAATQTLTNKTISGASNTITNISAASLTGAVAIGNGGTGQTTAVAAFDALAPTTTTGDTSYYNGTDNVRLPVGSTGQLLTVAGGIPAWASSFPGDKSFTSSSVLTLSSSTTTAGSRFSATNSDASRWLVNYSGDAGGGPAAIWWATGSDLQIGTSTAANGTGFSEKARITSAGVLQVPNGVLVPTAAFVGNVYSGTAASNTVTAASGWSVNPTANAPYHYTRVGNVVTVSGRFENGTLPATTDGLTSLNVPIASNFTAFTDAWGVMNTSVEGVLMKDVYADTTNDTIVFTVRNTTGGAIAVSTVQFTYSYRVL